MNEKSYCYIVKTSANTLYCGWTLDLKRRIEEHNSPDSKTKHTRVRQPVELVYFEEFDTRSKACQRECQIKELTRDKKIELIKLKHPDFTIGEYQKIIWKP